MSVEVVDFFDEVRESGGEVARQPAPPTPPTPPPDDTFQALPAAGVQLPAPEAPPSADFKRNFGVATDEEEENGKLRRR